MLVSRHFTNWTFFHSCALYTSVCWMQKTHLLFYIILLLLPNNPIRWINLSSSYEHKISSAIWHTFSKFSALRVPFPSCWEKDRDFQFSVHTCRDSSLVLLGHSLFSKGVNTLCCWSRFKVLCVVDFFTHSFYREEMAALGTVDSLRILLCQCFHLYDLFISWQCIFKPPKPVLLFPKLHWMSHRL